MKSSDGKTVFREVFVKGKSMRYFAGFHDFKAEAINQTYVPIVENKKALDPGWPMMDSMLFIRAKNRWSITIN